MASGRCSGGRRRAGPVRDVQAWLGWAGTYKYSHYHHIYDYVSILNSGYVGAPGGYGIKALAFSNGALHFDTPEYGTDNPDTFIHVRDSGTSVFGAGTSTSLSTSNGAAGNLLLACVATDGDMGAIVSDGLANRWVHARIR